MTVEDALARLAALALERVDAYDALDAVAGDGDFGETLARGAQALLAVRAELAGAPADAALRVAASAMADAMGGTSGAMWGVALLRAARAAPPAGAVLDPAAVAAMGEAAVAGIEEYGGARVGDKTMLDALVPAVAAVRGAAGAADDIAAAAAAAARAGAEGTRGLTARRGRASYSDRSDGSPDAGAVAVADLAEALAAPGGPCAWDEAERRAADRADRSATRDDDTGRAAVPKSFRNDPADVVDESLRGLAAAHAGVLRLVAEPRYVVRADAPVAGKVALVSGGGSGHEPLHAGFVGPGMLDAAVPGAVFTAASAAQVRAAARAADGGAGVLLVVKNYTGDVAQFRLGAELLAADGVRTELVLVADDVAVDEADGPGRRGTGLTPVVEKLCGARAEAGGTLDEVAALGRRVARRGASFGVALSSVAPPGRPPILDLGPDEIEVGVGIHGEAGRRRERLRPARELVATMAGAVLEALAPAPGARLLTLVNGLGGTSVLELYLLHGELDRLLRERGLHVERALVGTYVSSVAMAGASISLLELDDELTELWDAPVRTPALRWEGAP